MIFYVNGKVQGKARPRFSTNGGHIRIYTPQKTREYEELIQAEFLKARGQIIINYPVKVEILAYFKPPKSTNTRDLVLMRNGLLQPTKKPDVDNIIKVVLDALNGVAYTDDKQVVSVAISKRYSNKDYLLIKIEEIEGQINE